MKTKSKNMFVYAFVGLLVIAAIIIAFMLFSKPREGFQNNNYKLEYFMMESCPHCENFTSTWLSLEEEIQKNSLPITTVKHDIRNQGETRGRKFNINSAPTILLTKDDELVKEYNGPREIKPMMDFVKEEIK
jgi:thiol-disulfide isomerase/thioredoxin